MSDKNDNKQNNPQTIHQESEQENSVDNQQDNKQEGVTETLKENKNWKEQAYDRIPISLKALDIIIFILIAILFLMFTYFVIRKFS